MSGQDRGWHYGDCPRAMGGFGRCSCPVEMPAHCEGCGSTYAENLYEGDQGYTACCNEPVVDDCRTCTHPEGAVR